jgi:cytochrome c5
LSADPSHNSTSKTPAQRVTVVVLAVVVPIIIIVLLTQLVFRGSQADKDSAVMSPAAVEERIKPVADVNMGETAAARAPGASAVTAVSGAAGKPDGRKVYESTCTVCHGTGVANAPKFGDKAAWAPHLVHGVGHLYVNALKGEGAMPPKGGNLTLSDAEVKAAVDYMLSAVK